MVQLQLCGSLGWSISLYTKRLQVPFLVQALGCRFDPRLGHIQETTNQCFSLSLSFPLSLKSMEMCPWVRTERDRQTDRQTERWFTHVFSLPDSLQHSFFDSVFTSLSIYSGHHCVDNVELC